MDTGDWLKRVEPKDHLSILQCLLIGLLIALPVFCFCAYAEYDSSGDRYEWNETYGKKDAWGNKIYGAKIEGAEFSWENVWDGTKWFLIVSISLLYLSNFSKGFRDLIGSILDKIFS